MWQLTSDADGHPLFGSGGATPIITTLLVDEDGSGSREVPVAILPGGSGGAGSAGPIPGSPGCARASTDLSKFVSYAPRPRVPCYTTNLGARSLTIVRLDNGKNHSHLPAQQAGNADQHSEPRDRGSPGFARHR